MDTYYSLMDKIIGVFDYTVHAVRTGSKAFISQLEAHLNFDKTIEDFVKEAHEKRLQRNSELEKEKHSRYYRHS
jgi:hypothetical protein